MKALMLCAALLLVGCNKKPPFPEKPDSEANLVKQVRARLDNGEKIYDQHIDAVTGICRHRTDIPDCATVIPRLPPRSPQP